MISQRPDIRKIDRVKSVWSQLMYVQILITLSRTLKITEQEIIITQEELILIE